MKSPPSRKRASTLAATLGSTRRKNEQTVRAASRAEGASPVVQGQLHPQDRQQPVQALVVENVVLLPHKIRDSLADEFHLQGKALGIRSIEDDEVIEPKRGVRCPNTLDQFHDGRGFQARRQRRNDVDLGHGVTGRTGILGNPPRIVPNQAVGMFHDHGRAAVIDLKLMGLDWAAQDASLGR